MIRQPAYRMGVGASSILMILVVLCLTVLGILSFASARAGQTLADRRLLQVKRYYAAVAEAERALCALDGALAEAPEEGAAYAAYIRDLAERMGAAGVAEDLTITFAVPAGDSQELRVSVRPLGPGAAYRYRVTAHELANVEPWAPDPAVGLSLGQSDE